MKFDNTSTPAEPAYVAFCTQQDSLSFGADFRIAKSDDEANITKFLTRCRGTSDAACTTLTVPAAFSIPDATTKHRFSLFIHHPDYLHCDIVGPHAANLEMRLLAPSPPGAPSDPSSPAATIKARSITRQGRATPSSTATGSRHSGRWRSGRARAAAHRQRSRWIMVTAASRGPACTVAIRSRRSPTISDRGAAPHAMARRSDQPPLRIEALPARA